VEALRWVADHAAQLSIDVDRIAVAGASAGGGLASTLLQRCADDGFAARAQALLYPMLDEQSTTTAPGIDLVWGHTSNQFAWRSYIGNPPEGVTAYTSAARRSDLSTTPPTWIAVGELDILRHESVAYAERLRASAVECTLTIVPGMYHAADLLVPWSRQARELRDGMAAHLHAHLRG
jgi:acetyl esterase/lipase